MTAQCPSGGTAFKNLSVERLPAEAHWNYEVRHCTAYSAVTLCPAEITACCIHLHQQLSVSGRNVHLPYLQQYCLCVVAFLHRHQHCCMSCQCGEMAKHRNTGKSLYFISKYRMFLFPADRRVPTQRSARSSACIATGGRTVAGGCRPNGRSGTNIHKV